MKRIAFRLFVIVTVGVLAIKASNAFFSDRETSAENHFTAGKLDLRVNDQNNPPGIVTLSDMEAGDDRIATKTLFVDNNPARLFLHLKDLVPSQGEQTESETTEEHGTPKSDIQNYLTYDLVVGDLTIITSNSATPLVDAVSCWIPLGTIPGATTVEMLQSFHFDQGVTDWAQGDTLSFTEEFLAQQINDPTTPVTGSGRVWDQELSRCVDASPSPTPTPTPTIFLSPTPTPTPGDPFADDVTAVTGTFGAPSALSSDPNVAKPLVVGAPDGQFIQISDSSSVILNFVNNKAVDGSGVDIRIHNIDTLFPGEATVEVSDGGPFILVGSFFDTAIVDIDMSGTGLTEVTRIRLTDLVAGGDPYPTLGFDLDAIEAINNAAP